MNNVVDESITQSRRLSWELMPVWRRLSKLCPIKLLPHPNNLIRPFYSPSFSRTHSALIRVSCIKAISSSPRHTPPCLWRSSHAPQAHPRPMCPSVLPAWLPPRTTLPPSSMENLNCCCQNTPKYTLPAFSPPSSLRISHVRLPVFAHGSRHLYTAVHRLAALVKFFLLPPPPLLTHGGPSTSSGASSCQAVQAQRVRNRAQSSPALRSAVYKTPVIAPAPQHRVVLSTPQTFGPYAPRHTRRQARPNPPIPLHPPNITIFISLKEIRSAKMKYAEK